MSWTSLVRSLRTGIMFEESIGHEALQHRAQDGVRHCKGILRDARDSLFSESCIVYIYNVLMKPPYGRFERKPILRMLRQDMERYEIC